ncbi:MAG: hypothetical protein KDD60_11175, partial [Bdellovibrionales bacterium]|nr:hypothetical protein [Bdellovibrionales bacterium]
MISSLTDFFANKRVLLLGFGREGKSSLVVLQKLGSAKTIAVADQNPNIDVPNGVFSHTGDRHLCEIANYDIILKSPGVPLPSTLWKEYQGRITSQTEL